MIRITIRDKPRNRCAKLTPLRLAILRGIADGTPMNEVRKAMRCPWRHYNRSRNDLAIAGYLDVDWNAELVYSLTDKGREALAAA